MELIRNNGHIDKNHLVSKQEIQSSGVVNDKDADKPAHSHRLNAFVIRFLECVISKLVTSVITVFYLVSVVEETNLSLTISETQRQVLSCQGPVVA